MNNGHRRDWIKGALFYFAAVFGAGFLLGIFRVTLLVPRIGVRYAELLEMPLMILVSVLAARWAVRRTGVRNGISSRLAMGGLALGFMLVTELAMTVLLRNERLVDIAANRDPVSGTAYLFALVLFGLMPALITWFAGSPVTSESESSIEEFISAPDVSECNEILVTAPADVVFDVAEHLDIRSIPSVNAIFKLRECIFRLRPDERAAKSFIAETQSLGWQILKYRTGEELVMGAATQPWMGNVKFRPIPPEAFPSFSEPDFVKIVWTIEADPVSTEQ